jgi:hypothetical protein
MSDPWLSEPSASSTDVLFTITEASAKSMGSALFLAEEVENFERIFALAV